MHTHPIQFFKKHGIDPRTEQTAVINAIHANWGKYKYFALSLPTGVGKTYIATSIADSINRAYILTSTLQLQTQYEKSWDELVNLKGRGNYTCNLNNAFTVDAAPCTAQPKLIQSCKENRTCSYYNQKQRAVESKAMITNPVYMLYSTHCGFVKQEDETWTRREALIIDEAHNLEDHLVSFAESDVDPEMYEKEFGISSAQFQFTGRPIEDYQMVIKVKEALMLKAEEIARQIEEEFPQKSFADVQNWARGITQKVAERVQKLNAKAYQVDKAIQPLKIFFNTHSTPEELTRRWIVSKYDDKNVLKLAPIYGDFLFHGYFDQLAEKFIFLSATLGSKREFCKELGIREDECFFMETDSPFNPTLSPVLALPKITLSKDRYAENVGKVGKLVDDIMDLHPGERGIIHCVEGSMLINTSNGLKQIKEIQVGDEVQSWNEAKLKFENKSVTHVYDNGEKECIELTFEDGRSLICTLDHQVLTNRGYVEAQNLSEDDEIIDEFAEDRRV